MQQQQAVDAKSSLEGLWVLLVDDATDTEACNDPSRIPMMARAGNDQTYVLGFKNMHNARKFLTASDIEGVEPRMVVKSNKTEFISAAKANGVVGVLVDYDPSTQKYSRAAELY